MSIRVLYTIPNLDTAGSGKALANLIEHLDRSRFDPVVAVTREADTPVARRLHDVGVRVEVEATTVPARPVHSLRHRAYRRGHELRPIGADIWHSFHYLDDYTEPLVARAAGARWLYTKKNMSWNRRSWRLRTALAHAVLAQNTDMVESFFTPDRRHRVHLVPRGVPVPDLAGLESPTEVRRRHALPADAPLITCVARIQSRKRQAVLVDAIADVDGAHVVLAGAGDEDSVDAVEKAAGAAGARDRVHRLGQVDDVDSLVAASAIVCLPTAGPAAEGCPVALLEAMALGAAVVVTDIPGSRDVVRHGVDGLVVAPDDRDGLARALIGTARRPRPSHCPRRVGPKPGRLRLHDRARSPSP